MESQVPLRQRYIGDEDTLAIWWTISGELVDYTSGFTFVGKLTLTATPATVIFTKSTGFTGAAGSGSEHSGVPNLVVQWATSGELNDVTPGRYYFEIVATKTSDSSESTFRMELLMKKRLGS